MSKQQREIISHGCPFSLSLKCPGSPLLLNLCRHVNISPVESYSSFSEHPPSIELSSSCSSKCWADHWASLHSAYGGWLWGIVSSCGTSVVDYILVSTRLKHHVVNFAVGDVTFSDHLPLILVLDLHLGRAPPQDEADLNPECRYKIVVNSALIPNFHCLNMEPASSGFLSAILQDPDPFVQIKSFIYWLYF